MRGVNKLIVEIKDTENEYFDRAILFLKPDKAAAEQRELNEGAEKLLRAVRNGEGRHRKKVRWIITGVAIALAVGATVSLLIIL